MMDTIVFDYIYYDNNLLSLVKHLVDKKIVTVFVTHVQWAEISANCKIR
jgi:hypothetical protein